jgi:hypothetical protein
MRRWYKGQNIPWVQVQVVGGEVEGGMSLHGDAGVDNSTAQTAKTETGNDLHDGPQEEEFQRVAGTKEGCFVQENLTVGGEGSGEG